MGYAQEAVKYFHMSKRFEEIQLKKNKIDDQVVENELLDVEIKQKIQYLGSKEHRDDVNMVKKKRRDSFEFVRHLVIDIQLERRPS